MYLSVKEFMGGDKKKRIIFTGGGSTGHVSVNLALIPKFLEDGWKVAYIGSKTGIERELITGFKNVEYFPISTGKLRRYLDVKNFLDPFKVVGGVFQASTIIRKWKPHIIFSKGGFVSVPVVIGGRLNRIPTIIHESDITPGLANRIALPFSTRVLTTFPETKEHIKQDKVNIVGPVVRGSLKHGNADKGRALCGFDSNKPVLLVAGGSLGSVVINKRIRDDLDELLSDFQIIHLTGKGKQNNTIQKVGYKSFEYVDEELPDILAMTDIVLSRAGSNMIFEFLSLKKPMLLVPLPKASSRGDQILNAQSFEKSGFAHVLYEEDMTKEAFLKALYKVYNERHNLINNMEKAEQGNHSLDNIYNIIQKEKKE